MIHDIPDFSREFSPLSGRSGEFCFELETGSSMTVPFDRGGPKGIRQHEFALTPRNSQERKAENRYEEGSFRGAFTVCEMGRPSGLLKTLGLAL